MQWFLAWYKRHTHIPYALLIVFLLALSWFSFLQPWGSFRDPDTFYHAKLTDIILHGTTAIGAKGITLFNLFFLQNFPWLDLTILNEKFVDQHLLYHLALAPFISFFGMFHGTQVATVVFASAFITIFYAILRALRLQYPALWTFLVAVSMPLSFRLSLGKATPFALTFFLLGLLPFFRTRAFPRAQLGSPKTRTELGSGLAGFGFALSHGGWIILLVSQVIMITARCIYRYFISRNNARGALYSDLRPLGLSALGILLALLIHPNRANLWDFLNVQVFQVAIATPKEIQLGLEWSSITLIQLISNIGPLLIMGCIVVLGCLFAWPKTEQEGKGESIAGLGALSSVLIVFTLKSGRMVEYFVPVLALLLARIWNEVDVYQLKASLRAFIQEKSFFQKKNRFHAWIPSVFMAVFISIVLVVLVRDARGTFIASRLSRPFTRLAPIVDVLKQNASPGERIFQDRWDSFGELFALAPEFRYVSGVDPTFLLAANPELALGYEKARINPKATLPDLLKTRFSLIERTTNCRDKSQQIFIKMSNALLCEGSYPP